MHDTQGVKTTSQEGLHTTLLSHWCMLTASNRDWTTCMCSGQVCVISRKLIEKPFKVQLSMGVFSDYSDLEQEGNFTH